MFCFFEKPDFLRCCWVFFEIEYDSRPTKLVQFKWHHHWLSQTHYFGPRIPIHVLIRASISRRLYVNPGSPMKSPSSAPHDPIPHLSCLMVHSPNSQFNPSAWIPGPLFLTESLGLKHLSSTHPSPNLHETKQPAERLPPRLLSPFGRDRHARRRVTSPAHQRSCLHEFVASSCGRPGSQQRRTPSFDHGVNK